MRAIKCDLNKAIVNIGFVGAVLTAFILCFTAIAYTDEIGKTYSVFEAMFSLDKEIISSDYTLSSVYVFKNCLFGYIQMFIPIIVAFPFMVTFCAERNSGLMRLAIARTGKTKYCLSKFCACFLSAGLAVMLGVALYGIIVKLAFPDILSYDIDPELMKIYFPNGFTEPILRTLAAAFLYGAVSVMPAFFISSFCKNPYLITCVPFLLVYLWDTTLGKLRASFIDAMDFDSLTKLTPFYPYSVTSAVTSELDRTAKIAIAFNSAYVAVLLVLFVVLMNARKDKGI